jgi:dTMP kinase
VHVTREPSTGPVGVLIREILTGKKAERSAKSAEMMALLFAADRLDHNLAEIDPHLEEGHVVLSDRYDLSSLAYQSAASSEGSMPKPELLAWIGSLNRFARRPDLTLVVDVTAEVAAERRRRRGGADELYEVAELQRRLALAYANAEELVPGDRLVHVDGDRSLDEVEASIRAALDPIVLGVTGG